MSEKSKVALSAQNIYRSYVLGDKKIDVLNGLDLKVESGESVFLCGSSGAGKTTLMYTLAGLEKPDKGEVFIEGSSLYELSKSKQADFRNNHLSYIFQNYYLLPELTALENVMIPTLIAKKASEERAKEMMDRVGIGHRLSHLPSELSGGEQQRVAIARALINKPSIIFADEPTGNLDSKNSDNVMELLLNVTQERGATLIVVTHNEGLARFGDRLITMRDGMIV